MPVFWTLPSQMTAQVQPLASGTVTVRVDKSEVRVAVMFWDWIAADRLTGAGVGEGSCVWVETTTETDPSKTRSLKLF